MRIHVLQHVPFETEGHIARWAADRRHPVDRSLLFSGDPPPAPDAFDWLVVMGGPMGVYDGATCPWLAAEKAAIRRAIDGGKRVTGICLGAQLIAEVLGARVTRNAETEIGWYAVERTESAKVSPLFSALPARFPAFHWHGDTFEIPAGAVHGARTEACENQAFSLDGGRVVGLQFHLEATDESVRALCENCADELVDSPHIQTAAAMIGQVQRLAESNAVMETLLDAIAR